MLSQIDSNQANSWIIHAVRQIPKEELSPEGNFQAHFFGVLFNTQRRYLNAPRHARLQSELEKLPEFHGMRRRPDIVFHIPKAVTGEPTTGNFVVMQLKFNAYRGRAKDDLEILREFKRQLNYQLGYFVNVRCRGRTYLDKGIMENSDNWQNGYLHELSYWFENSVPRLRHICVDQNGEFVISCLS